jgi:hypothetical protein
MTFLPIRNSKFVPRESRKVLVILGLLLIAANLTPAEAEPTSKLITCVNLQSKTERISKTGKCRLSHEAQANWHLLESDSRLPEKGKSKTLVVCSNKRTSSVSYQIIRARCARHQDRSEFYRSNLLVPAPKITNVIAIGHDSAQISIATDPNANPDAPVAYYTITSSKGQVKNVYSWGELRFTIDSLSELTDYSFTVSATTADGTSQLSLPSESIKTTKYVAQANSGATSTSVSTAPVAQVSVISNETATVSIPTGATSVEVSAPSLGNPSLTIASQSSVVSATFQSTSNPVGGSATPFTVSGSTKIVDISVSGLTGSATVCLDASPTAKLWHFIGGAWVDITTSRTSTQVCGVTSTFSPFVGEIQLAAPAFTLSSSAETRTVNTSITGYAISHTGGLQLSYEISPAISNTPGLAFSTSTGLVSGTPTSVASATTYTITATNPTGSASRTFTLTVVEALAAPAFTLSSSSENRTVNTAITGYTISSTGGTIASYSISPTAPAGLTFSTSTGLLSGSPTSVASATPYIITATNATGSVSRTFTLTVSAAITYTVGSNGPGGGKIFYVASTPFACGPTRSTTCTYLEAAYAGFPGGESRTWAQATPANYQGTRVSNTSSPETATATGIGWGYWNTRAIVSQGNSNPSTSAAAWADSFTNTVSSVVYDDWYLPSSGEITQLWINRTAVGMNDDNTYWSSTENSTNANQAHSERIGNFGGGLNSILKSISAYVRPIRAF